MPDASGNLTPGDVTSMPQQPPADAPPMPLEPTTNVVVSEGEPTQQQPDTKPPGYIPPGQGLDELDPDGDGALRPGRASQVMEEHEQRTSAGSGGFKLDPEAMRALLPEWENIRDELRLLREDGDRLEEVVKPADDEASTTQIQAAAKHQGIYATIIDQQYRYAKEYVNALEQAINKTEGSDQAAGDAARTAGQDV